MAEGNEERTLKGNWYLEFMIYTIQSSRYQEERSEEEKKKKKRRSQFDIRRGQPLTLFFPRQNQPTLYASLFFFSSWNVEVEINRLYAMILLHHTVHYRWLISLKQDCPYWPVYHDATDHFHSQSLPYIGQTHQLSWQFLLSHYHSHLRYSDYRRDACTCAYQSDLHFDQCPPDVSDQPSRIHHLGGSVIAIYAERICSIPEIHRVIHWFRGHSQMLRRERSLVDEGDICWRWLSLMGHKQWRRPRWLRWRSCKTQWNKLDLWGCYCLGMRWLEWQFARRQWPLHCSYWPR